MDREAIIKRIDGYLGTARDNPTFGPTALRMAEVYIAYLHALGVNPEPEEADKILEPEELAEPDSAPENLPPDPFPWIDADHNRYTKRGAYGWLRPRPGYSQNREDYA